MPVCRITLKGLERAADRAFNKANLLQGRRMMFAAELEGSTPAKIRSERQKLAARMKAEGSKVKAAIRAGRLSGFKLEDFGRAAGHVQALEESAIKIDSEAKALKLEKVKAGKKATKKKGEKRKAVPDRLMRTARGLAQSETRYYAKWSPLSEATITKEKAQTAADHLAKLRQFSLLESPGSRSTPTSLAIDVMLVDLESIGIKAKKPAKKKATKKKAAKKKAADRAWSGSATGQYPAPNPKKKAIKKKAAKKKASKSDGLTAKNVNASVKSALKVNKTLKIKNVDLGGYRGIEFSLEEPGGRALDFVFDLEEGRLEANQAYEELRGSTFYARGIKTQGELTKQIKKMIRSSKSWFGTTGIPFPGASSLVKMAANRSYDTVSPIYIRTGGPNSRRDRIIDQISLARGVKLKNQNGTDRSDGEGNVIYVDSKTRGGGTFSDGGRGWAILIDAK